CAKRSYMARRTTIEPRSAGFVVPVRLSTDHVRSLSDTLRSFVRWISNGEILSLHTRVDWPQDLSSLSRRFTGYTWGTPLIESSTRVFGIAQLPARWPTGSLEELESAVFQPVIKEVPYGPSSVGLDHYLIVEILDATTARANLAMLVDARDWY